VHPRGQDGSLTNRFGFLGVDSVMAGKGISFDGMNEAGFTVSLHTMRMAEYERPDPQKLALRLEKVVPWLLGQFDSVAAAAEGLANVSVVSGSLTRELFAHWALADAQGNSAVLEYVGGRRTLHTNDVRVMTNDPDYLWHVKNLNMYVGLSPQVPNANDGIAVKTAIGEVPQVWSQGFNLAALPGDASPASRFVRLFYLRQYAVTQVPIASTDDAMVLATGLLNNVFIPKGTSAPMQPAMGKDVFDFTQWALLKLPAQRRLLFRGYRDMTWQQVNLSQVDWTQGSSVPVSDGSLGIQDVTANFRPRAAAEQVI